MATDPVPIDLPEDMPGLTMAIGYLCIAWGNIEATLNLIINIIYHEVGGRTVESDLPRMLKPKVKFLRRCAAKIEALKPFADDLLSLLVQVDLQSTTRHAVIHGHLSAYDRATGTVTFTRLDGGGTQHTVSAISGTIQDLTDAGNVATKLGNYLADLMTRLGDAFPTNKSTRRTQIP